jgi:hypothetical protein
MLSTVVLPLFVAINTQDLPQPTLQGTCYINVLKWAAEHPDQVLAKRKEPGPDHGGDPNDEQHDPGLPANAHAGDGYPSDDPYNDTTPNNKNHPYRPY